MPLQLFYKPRVKSFFLNLYNVDTLMYIVTFTQKFKIKFPLQIQKYFIMYKLCTDFFYMLQLVHKIYKSFS